MSHPTLRDEIIHAMDQLSDGQLEILLQCAEQLRILGRIRPYDAATDPVLTGEALFDGPPDLSVRAEEIFENGFGRPSTKDDSM